MGFPHGTHIGGVRTLRDLYDRCYVDPATGCHHFRKADGKPWPEGTTPSLWHHESRGSRSARNLAYELSHPDRKLSRSWVVFSSCGAHDCIADGHLKAMHRGAYCKALAVTGAFKSATKTIAIRRAGAKRSRITPEVWQWVLESTQTNRDIAHALQVAHTHISNRRIKHRKEHMLMGHMG